MTESSVRKSSPRSSGFRPGLCKQFNSVASGQSGSCRQCQQQKKKTFQFKWPGFFKSASVIAITVGLVRFQTVNRVSRVRCLHPLPSTPRSPHHPPRALSIGETTANEKTSLNFCTLAFTSFVVIQLELEDGTAHTATVQPVWVSLYATQLNSQIQGIHLYKGSHTNMELCGVILEGSRGDEMIWVLVTIGCLV